MKTRDIVIGFIVLVFLIVGVLWIRNARNKKVASLPVPTPNIADQISKIFNYQIPADANKADLKDVTGGNGSGIATAKFANGSFTSTVLVDLPDPVSGKFYQAWLIRGNSGDANYSIISLGVLRAAKGGFLVDFQSAKDYSDYKNVVVSIETGTVYGPTSHVLEGSF